jgi:hypothetical protein
MTTYMASFRVEEVGNDQERRRNLEAEILRESAMHWKDTTSFLIIEVEDTIDNLASRCKEWIAQEMDVVLFRTLGKQEARVIGAVEDQDLFALMPYCKRA